DVIVCLHAFACVMKQKREIEEIGLLKLFEEFGVALVPFRLRLAEGMEIFDSHESVLVNGEAVGIVANDERVNGAKLGQKQSEQAERVHGAQRVGRVRRN